jgi:pimeloyl-ACP methyl ester carboxylesterase
VEELQRQIPGLILTEREHLVPLDHNAPGGGRLSVFTRELADPEGLDRPLLQFLQGGPGAEAPRPSRTDGSPPWLERALRDFRVLMLDQRGTGRSSPIAAKLPGSPQQQADYLAHFRADSIVADAEWIRRELEAESWSVLGQSFGGFCALRYMSFAPEGLREVLFTGGVPPLGVAIEDVYRATYSRMRERNERFYERYPDDRERVLELHQRLEQEPLLLPSGDRLHSRRLRQLGQLLGMSDGNERLHYLLELDPESPAFAHDAEGMGGFARNPLYAVLQEACWANGGNTRWAAERVLGELEWPAEHFTGEHVYPWMFEDFAGLAPLGGAAELLAQRQWPALYDPERLRENEVPAAALIYADDPYVERTYSERTVAMVPKMRHWLTSEYDHDGLRKDGGRVLGRLLDLVRGRV